MRCQQQDVVHQAMSAPRQHVTAALCTYTSIKIFLFLEAANCLVHSTIVHAQNLLGGIDMLPLLQVAFLDLHWSLAGSAK